MTIFRVFFCTLITFAFVLPIQAATPLQTHDLNPLTLIYGLPLASPARIPQQQQLGASLNVSNTTNIQNHGNESLYIDGETSELNFIYALPIDEQTSIRIRLPWIKHQAGSLDGFINNFHQSLGFPDGDRLLTDEDQFLFQYQVDSVNLINMSEANAGLGDISIDSAYQLVDDTDYAASLWSSLKLPTGDSDKLSGSGNFDVAVWYAAENQFMTDWTRYFNIGLLITGDSEVLAESQKNEIYFGMAGIEWQLNDYVALNLQLDFHTAFYQSYVKFLGNSVQLSSGGHIKLSPSSRLDIVVVEDIQVGASPDVTFQLGYTQLF